MSQFYTNHEPTLAELGLGLMSPWRNSPTLESLRRGTLAAAQTAEASSVQSNTVPIASKGSGPMLASMLTGASSSARSPSSLPPRHNEPRRQSDVFSWLSRAEEETNSDHNDRPRADSKQNSGDKSRPTSCNTSILSVQLTAVVYQLRELCCELQQDSTTVWFDYRRCLQEEKKYLADLREARVRAETAEKTIQQQRNSLAMYEEIERVRSKDDDRQQKSIEDLRKFLEKERQVRQEAEESQKRIALVWVEKDERQQKKIESLEKEVQKQSDILKQSENIAQIFQKELAHEREARTQEQKLWSRQKAEKEDKLAEECRLRELAEKKLADASKAFALRMQAENIRIETELQKILALQRVAEEERHLREEAEEKLEGLRTQIGKEVKRRERADEMLLVLTQSVQLQKESEQSKMSDDLKLKKEYQDLQQEERSMREKAGETVKRLEARILAGETLLSEFRQRCTDNENRFNQECEVYNEKIRALESDAEREQNLKVAKEESLNNLTNSLFCMLEPHSEDAVKSSNGYKSSFSKFSSNRSLSGVLDLLEHYQQSATRLLKENEFGVEAGVEARKIEVETLRSELITSRNMLEISQESIRTLGEKEQALKQALDNRTQESQELTSKADHLEAMANECRARCADLEIDKQSLNAQVQQQSRNLRLAADKLDEHKSALERREQDLSLVQKALETVTQMAKEQQEKAKKSQEDLELFNRNFQNETIARDLKEKQQLESELDKLRDDLRQEKLKKEVVDQTVETAKQTIQHLNNAEKETNERLQSTLSELNLQNEKAKALEDTLAQIKTYSAVAKDLAKNENKQEVEALTLECEFLRRKVSEKKDRYKRIEENLQYAISSAGDQKKVIAALELLTEQAEVQVQKTAVMLKAMQDNCNAQVAKLIAVRQSTIDFENDKKSLESQLEAEQSERTRLEFQIKASEEQMQNVQLQKEAISVECEHLRIQLDHQKVRRETAASRLWALINEYKNLRVKIEEDTVTDFARREQSDVLSYESKLPVAEDETSPEAAISHLENVFTSVKKETFEIQHQLILKSVEERTVAENLRSEVMRYKQLLQLSETSVQALRNQAEESRKALTAFQTETESKILQHTQTHQQQLDDARVELAAETRCRKAVENSFRCFKQIIENSKKRLQETLESALSDSERTHLSEIQVQSLPKSCTDICGQTDTTQDATQHIQYEIDSLEQDFLAINKQLEHIQAKSRTQECTLRDHLTTAKSESETERCRRRDLEEILETEKAHLNQAKGEADALRCLLEAEMDGREKAEAILRETQESLRIQAGELVNQKLRAEALLSESRENSERAAKHQGALNQFKLDVEHAEAQNREQQEEFRKKLEKEVDALRSNLIEEVRKREQTDSILQASRQSLEQLGSDLAKQEQANQSLIIDFREQCERAARAEGALQHLKAGIEAEQAKRMEVEQNLNQEMEKKSEFLRERESEEKRKREQAEALLFTSQQALHSKEADIVQIMQNLEDLRCQNQKLLEKANDIELERAQEASRKCASESRWKEEMDKIKSEFIRETESRSITEENLATVQRLHREQKQAIQQAIAECQEERDRAIRAENALLALKEKETLLIEKNAYLQKELESANVKLDIERAQQRSLHETLCNLQQLLDAETQRAELEKDKTTELSAEIQRQSERGARFKESLQQLKLDMQAERLQASLELKQSKVLNQKELNRISMELNSECEQRLQAEERWKKTLNLLEYSCTAVENSLHIFGGKNRTLYPQTLSLIAELDQIKVLMASEMKRLAGRLQSERAERQELHEQLEMARCQLAHEIEKEPTRNREFQEMISELTQKQKQLERLEDAMRSVELEKEKECSKEKRTLEATMQDRKFLEEKIRVQEVTLRLNAEETEKYKSQAEDMKNILCELKDELEMQQIVLVHERTIWSNALQEMDMLCSAILARSNFLPLTRLHPNGAELEIEEENKVKGILYDSVQEELSTLKARLRQAELLKEEAQAQLVQQRSQFQEQLQNVIHACVAEELVSEESRKREEEALAKLSLSCNKSQSSIISSRSNDTFVAESLRTDLQSPFSGTPLDASRSLGRPEESRSTGKHQNWLTDMTVASDFWS